MNDPSEVGEVERERVRADPQRLGALHATGLLDTAPEPDFDAVTRLVAVLLDVPAAFVSLVDAHRDFYKSCVGFGEPLATVRQLEGTTFCHYAIASPGPLVIEDTRSHPVYSLVPTVESLGVAAYLGVPIRVDGRAIGSLCAIDFAPRRWTRVNVAAMIELAASVEREIEIRRQQTTMAELTVELEVLVEQAQAANLELEAGNRALTDALADAEAARAAATAARAEAQEARSAAESANAAKSHFLAAMSHEIRTPINAVLGYADLLDLCVAGPLTPRQSEYVTRIRSSGRHLLGLIDEVLDFSKIEAGEMRVERVPADLRDALGPAIEMVAPLAEARGVSLALEAGCGVPREYVGDDYRVRQILVNLLSNAVKFTDAGGSIRVACRSAPEAPAGMRPSAAGPWVVVAVHDTGRGIEPAQCRRIFEPFVQAESETSRRPDGTGLGLTISRRLARLMGGDLTVESEPGVGSAFSLCLPAAPRP